MEKNWVKIFESPNEQMIGIACQVLEEAGIEVVVINKKDRSYHIGDIELYVDRDKVILAKTLTKDLLI